MASTQLNFSSMAISRLQHQNGLCCIIPVTRSYGTDLRLMNTQSCYLKFKTSCTRPTLLLKESDIPSHQGDLVNECDAESLKAIAAEITSNTCGSFPADDEFNLDRPTAGFSSISEAIEDIRQGRMVIVVDDEERENEGDLIMAASLVTPETMAFIVKHGTGIVCVSMKGEDLERLKLPLMVSQNENAEKLTTAFTVSVDAKYGTTTGVSARDRAATILALALRNSKPEDFNRPGHIFPLKYREGGVLKRAGHTEASLDLAVLAGLEPVAVLCEVVDDDGSMARLPRLRQFAKEENLKIISIADLIRYRRKREKLVELAGVAPIPTMWGPFNAYCFKSLLDGIEHIAMVKVRVCNRSTQAVHFCEFEECFIPFFCSLTQKVID